LLHQAFLPLRHAYAFSQHNPIDLSSRERFAERYFANWGARISFRMDRRVLLSI
jgi:hypothetical protein